MFPTGIYKPSVFVVFWGGRIQVTYSSRNPPKVGAGCLDEGELSIQRFFFVVNLDDRYGIYLWFLNKDLVPTFRSPLLLSIIIDCFFFIGIPNKNGLWNNPHDSWVGNFNLLYNPTQPAVWSRIMDTYQPCPQVLAYQRYSHLLRYIWYIYLAGFYNETIEQKLLFFRAMESYLVSRNLIQVRIKEWGVVRVFRDVYLVLVHALATCIWYAYHSITPHSRTIPICHIQYPGPCTHVVYPCTDPCIRYILVSVPAPSTRTHPYPERAYPRTVPLIKACTHIPYLGTHGTHRPYQRSTTATSLRTVPVPVHKSHHPVPIRRLRIEIYGLMFLENAEIRWWLRNPPNSLTSWGTGRFFPLFTGFYTSQTVWDFFHQQYVCKTLEFWKIFLNAWRKVKFQTYFLPGWLIQGNTWQKL